MIRVGIIEDDKNVVKLLKTILEHMGNIEVVFEAFDTATAEEKVENVENFGADVIFLDGNLHARDDSGNDGRKLLAQIRAQRPETKVVWTSTSDHGTEVKEPEAVLKKGEMLVGTVMKTVRELFKGK